MENWLRQNEIWFFKLTFFLDEESEMDGNLNGEWGRVVVVESRCKSRRAPVLRSRTVVEMNEIRVLFERLKVDGRRGRIVY